MNSYLPTRHAQSELLDKSVFMPKLIKIVASKENIQLIKCRDQSNYAHFSIGYLEVIILDSFIALQGSSVSLCTEVFGPGLPRRQGINQGQDPTADVIRPFLLSHTASKM